MTLSKFLPLLAFEGDQIASFTETQGEWKEIRQVTQDLEPSTYLGCVHTQIEIGRLSSFYELHLVGLWLLCIFIFLCLLIASSAFSLFLASSTWVDN